MVAVYSPMALGGIGDLDLGVPGGGGVAADVGGGDDVLRGGGRVVAGVVVKVAVPVAVARPVMA